MAENNQNGKLFYFLMICAATLIILLPVGIANLFFGYVLHDSPCSLCWGQRIAMIFIGTIAFFIVRYGAKPQYLATLLVFTAGGLYQSFRHFASHGAHDLDQGFGLPIFGIHTYFWAEIVFWAVVLLLGVMFFFAPKEGFKPVNQEGKPWFKFGGFGKLCAGISLFVLCSNLVQAIVSTGLPPNYGQGDPIRFSWNTAHTIHTTEGMDGMWSTISFLGARDVKDPDFAFKHNGRNLGITFSNDNSQAPLDVDQQLQIKEEKPINIAEPLNTLSLINGEYVVSSKFDVWYLDQDLKQVDALEIDPLYSATIDPIVGIIPWDNGKYVLIGSNKTLLRYEKSPTDNPDAQLIGRYSDFEKGENKFLASDRGRVHTVRSQYFHIMSFAADDKYAYSTTVPNNKNKTKFNIIKILQKDLTLSGEFTPNAKLKDKRTLGELYVTGLACDNGKLYAVSKNYNIILEIDLQTEEVTKVYGLPSTLSDVRGLIKTADGFQLVNNNKLVTLN